MSVARKPNSTFYFQQGQLAFLRHKTLNFTADDLELSPSSSTHNEDTGMYFLHSAREKLYYKSLSD